MTIEEAIETLRKAIDLNADVYFYYNGNLLQINEIQMAITPGYSNDISFIFEDVVEDTTDVKESS